MPKYEDDKFAHIESDIEKIRIKPTMYISYVGAQGALHLSKEIINNAYDEALSPRSPADRVEIEFDANHNQLTVIDNGRGIPFDKVEMVCSYLQAGSNVFKQNEKTYLQELSGTFGIGLTAVNALAERFTLVIRREGKKGIFTFIDGKLQPPVYEKCKKTEHGTAVIFVPSEEYLGKCKIDPKELISWVEEMTYLLSKDIYTTFNYIKKGKEIPVTYEFNTFGVDKLLDTMLEDPVIKTVHLTHEFEDGFGRYDIVFNMSAEDTSDFKILKSFCNRVNTIDRGTHVDAAQQGWCRALTKLAKERMSEKEWDDLKITAEDCRIGLAAVVTLYTPNPKFTGQTKQKVDIPEVFKPMTQSIMNELIEYFHRNPTEEKKIVSIIKKSAKARKEVTKVRKADYKAPDSFEAALSNLYRPCRSNDYRELWVMEGESAIGGFINGRDERFQAGFRLKGNPKNIYGLTKQEILQNFELRELARACGCGICDDFKIEKLRFDKIIFFTDSDIDGHNMTSLLSAFVLLAMPKAVEEGRVYRAVAPLYLLKGTKKFLTSKAGYYRLFAETIAKNVKLRDANGNVLNRSEILDLIVKNKDYQDELLPISKFYFTNNEIIEFAVLNDELSPKEFKKALKKKFKELDYDEKANVVTGIYNMTGQYIHLGKSFNDRCKRLHKLIHDDNNSKIYYQMDGVDGLISIGTFFNLTEKYKPAVDERIKGVGELSPETLWETTLNPKNRNLIRLTCEDLKQELETVKILHGPDPDERKKFMEGYIYSKEDIDT